jgi:DNA-binding FadR family transcriptional regulator
VTRRRWAEGQALLAVVAAAGHPVGARQATDALREHGFVVSESTVSRLLRQLDADGLTSPLDGKGRVLTDEGRRRDGALRSDQVPGHDRIPPMPTLDIATLQDLLDLLNARRAVEREAAREAATRASEADVANLERLLETHRGRLGQGEIPRDDALEFHRTIGRASGNRVLRMMTDLVLNRRLDRIESVLDVIVGSHHSEALSLDEHEEIVGAIRARQSEQAEVAMQHHLDRLIQEVQATVDTGHAEIYERLLVWMKQ